MNRFLTEMLQQPQALQSTLDFYEKGEGADLLENVSSLYRQKKFTSILLTGMGSSYFVSYAASCLLNEHGIRSHAINASELLHYHRSLLKEDTMLVCLSQSGESYEIVEILKKLPTGVTCLGITNKADSTLGNTASLTLLTRAGEEKMTSSKTYVSTTLVILLLGWRLAGHWNAEKRTAVQNAIFGVGKVLESRKTWVPDLVNFLGDFHFLEIIGRGPASSPAMQGSLMFKEATGSAAEGILGGEFRHGPMEMVNTGFKAVVLAPKGRTFDQSLKMARDIVKFGGKVILVTNVKIETSDVNIHVVQVPDTDEHLFCMFGIVTLQLMVNQWALLRGIEPGLFTRGAKITTTE